MVFGDIVVDAQADIVVEMALDIIAMCKISIRGAISQGMGKLIVILVASLAVSKGVEHVEFPLLVGV